MKINTLYHKTLLTEKKGRPQTGRKYFNTYIQQKTGLVSRTYTTLLQINKRKLPINPIKKWSKDRLQHAIQIPSKHKTCSTCS